VEPERVSPREREVLELLGDHLTHEEIGQRLFISVRTVESHVASLRRKLGLPDHRALVRHAVAARSAAPGPAVLPAPLTSFVGRERELRSLQAALQEARLVSAVGPGGVGKTRLALAGATALTGAYPGGVRWVDLVPVTEPGRLADAVAQACDAAVSSHRGPVEALIAALRGRPALLVLDNAEHLVNAVAVLAERLVSACPQLTILVTSRARLALPFERVVQVPGLDPGGDATALFVERAAAAGSPVPAPAERKRISVMCEALGGLPLAVELAAVRLPTLGLDGVERGLVDQSTLLRGGARLHQRHRSMSETIDWSVALIDPAAATALRRLGVLVAPFDADAAVAVAAFPPLSAGDVRAALVQLSEHNLLATTAGGAALSHRMLEPIRQYGLARMTAGDRPAYAQHLAWCLREAEAALAGERGGDGVRMIADDARAALAWAARPERPPGAARSPDGAHPLARRFGLLLYRDGTIREAQERLEQAAAFAADGTGAAADLGRAAAVAKCRVAGEDALRLELAAAGRATDPRDRARALGRAAELLNRFPGMFAEPSPQSADDLLRRAVPLAAGDPHATAVIAVAAASYAAASGAPTLASTQAALAAARAVPDAVLESGALDALIAATIFGGDVVEAHRLAQQRLALLPPWRDDPAAGLELKDALHVATFCALGAGDLTTAQDMARRQHELPFLRERRDLADDELMAPAALAGHWDEVLAAGQRFAEDWTAAGRPAAPGRGLAPAAVALAHGLRGEHEERQHWLQILAQVRGVAAAGASRGSGYGELFEALVDLHEDDPQAALGVLAAAQRTGLFPLVFTQWIAAVQAEAAVLAGAPDAGALLAQARSASAGNPMAIAITRRAAGLRSADHAAVTAAAAEFAVAGSAYQRDRTRALARRLPAGKRP
jgi:predicted ATPase/DNA-binding CsgD family transcriptional regulator